MGGLIAVNLALKYNIYALATLSSPIYYFDIKRVFLNVFQDFKTKKFINLKRYMNSSGKMPFSALVNFRIILSKTKPLFKNLKCPLFVAQGLLDDTVNHHSAKYIYNNAGSYTKEIRYYKNSAHLICHSSESNTLFQELESFINRISQ
jgi:carboxylesterase